MTTMAQHSAFRRQITDNFSWYSLSFAFNFLTRLVCLGLLWRSLGLEAQKSYALLQQIVVGLVIVIADFGLENSVIRFFQERPGFLAIAIRLFKRVSLTVVVPVAAILSIWWYVRYGTLQGAAACTAGYGYALFQIAGATHRSATRVKMFVGLNTVRNVLIVAGTIVLFFRFGSLTLLTWFTLYGVLSLVVGLVMFATLPAGARTKEDTGEPGRYYRYIVPVLFVNLALWLEGFVDTVFLNYYHPSQLPIFRAVLDYCLFFGVVTLLINRAWPAIYFRFARTMPSSLLLIRQVVAAHTGAAISAPVLLVAAPGVLELAFEKILAAALLPAAGLILGANGLGIVVGVLRPSLEHERRTGRIFTVFVLAIAANVVGNALLVPPYGITGAAVAGIVAVLMMFWGLFVSVRELRRAPRAWLVCLGEQLGAGILLTAIIPRLF